MNRQKIKKFSRGGVEVPHKKHLTSDSPIEVLSTPDEVAIPISQHVGKPADPNVEVGDEVVKGECIAQSSEGLCARIHASIGGVVKAIETRPQPAGEAKCIVIKRQEEKGEEIVKGEGIQKGYPKPDKVRSLVEEAGIVGLGGAGFPTHVKLKPPEDKEVDTVIVNGGESEPFVTCDQRLLLENSDKVLDGLELIRRTVGAKRGIVAIETNKPDALKKMQEEIKDWEALEVIPLDDLYPHGAEKKLIEAVLDREIPRGGLPFDVGVVVNNVQTAVSISEAIRDGKHLTERVLTVSGEVVEDPANLRVPLGTSIKDLIDYCGGLRGEDYRIVMGGPMTGFSVEKEEVPITKKTSGVIFLPSSEYAEYKTRVCIRCAKCVDACPVYLAPNRICDFANNDLYKRAEEIGIKDCIECGACAFVCPSKRPLLKWIREGKASL